MEQLTHLALAQYYRWYQVYEIPFTDTTIANQKAILTDDVTITSQAGTTQGKGGLEERLRLFTGWLNAHHVQNTHVTELADGKLALEADILYQNIRPDNSKYSYTLHYATTLEPQQDELPLFATVTLTPTGVVDEFEFEEAYSTNRAKSFMHYWLYLMECPNADKFLELLAPDFELELSSGKTINNVTDFTAWVTGNAQQIKTSSHQAENFQATRVDEQHIAVSVEFNWRGITHNNEKMIARTKHQWLLVNDSDERFARMQKMSVTALVPFTKVEEF